MIDGMKNLPSGPLPRNELSIVSVASSTEAFLALRDAAQSLGLPYHTIQRGCRRGVFPSYRVGGRIRVRLSEIITVIEASRRGGV
jgi:excisionase family DNA binding protein